MTERKMATLDVVTSIRPIEGADAIEVARVRGWDVVVRKGEFIPGDEVVYFEVDSFLPFSNPTFRFLESRGSKIFNGVEGHVLRTVKLRGQISQGLVLKLDELATPEQLLDWPCATGIDVSDRLGVVKYEPPIPVSISGDVVGPFPTDFIHKTDAERIQNLTDSYAEITSLSGGWVATEKVDGTSCTIICDHEGRLRVCGRNWELKHTPGNTLWTVALKVAGKYLAPGHYLQGEVYGEGIQGNPLKIRGHAFAPFSYGTPHNVLPFSEWPHWIPEVSSYSNLSLPSTIDEALDQADGIESLISPGRKAEGIVWWAAKSIPVPEALDRPCFKVISNKYLLKQKD